jgi:putative endonuclease
MTKKLNQNNTNIIMKKDYCFWVYIMASKSGTIYIGITNNLYNRISAHKKGTGCAFTEKYSCHKLIYFEEYQYVQDAISREKQLKKWSRGKKELLIHRINPRWADLSLDWI